jgi:hypothetical protein
MVLALMAATITMKDVPRRILYSSSEYSSRFCDQKHHPSMTLTSQRIEVLDQAV